MDGQIELGADCLTTLPAGFPFGHQFHHTDSLGTTATADVAEHLDIADGAIDFDDEGDEHFALNLIEFCLVGIMKIALDEGNERVCASRKLGVFFYHHKDLFFLFNLFEHRRYTTEVDRRDSCSFEGGDFMSYGIVGDSFGHGDRLLDGCLLAVLVDNLFVDGDEGGVVGHEVVFEAEFQYLLGSGVLVVGIFTSKIAEVFDALASPEVAQGSVGGVGLEAGEVVGLLEGFATHLAGEGDGALRFAIVFAEDEDGTLGHHVGYGGWLDVVSLEGAGIELYMSKDRGVDVLAEALGLGGQQRRSLW